MPHFLTGFCSFFTRLHDKPILYRGKDFYLVGFGLFAGLATFVGLGVFFTFIADNNIVIQYPKEMWAAIIIFFMAIFSKLIHPLVIGREYFNNPLFYIKQTAFYNQGGQFGVLCGLLLMAWVEDINILVLFDTLLYTFCAALIIARIGCYNYGCCYGKVTTSRFNVKYTNPQAKILRLHPELANVPVIPTQLYESIVSVFIFILMSIAFVLHARYGIASLIFVFLYNGFRIYIHRYRANDIMKINISSEDKPIFLYVATLFILLAIGILLAVIMFPHLFPEAYSQPISFFSYFKVNFTHFYHLITMIIISICVFLFYGLHYKNLGRQF